MEFGKTICICSGLPVSRRKTRKCDLLDWLCGMIYDADTPFSVVDTISQSGTKATFHISLRWANVFAYLVLCYSFGHIPYGQCLSSYARRAAYRSVLKRATMRRQGNFVDPGANASYPAGQQIQHQSSQRMEHNTHSDFQGQLEAFTPEREQPYSDSQADGQWGWEREGPNMSARLMASSIYNEAQAVDSSRSYYRNQMEPKVGMEKQGSDLRAQQAHQENPNIGYEDNRLLQLQTFEGIDQKFMDDITRLAKEQIEAEDAEIARHREKINTINTRYQEQLAALRARHATKRGEILRKESQSRQQQYNQQAMAVMKEEQYQREPMPPVHPHGSYMGNVQDPAANAPSRPYGSSDQFEAYGERAARFQGGTRDRGFNSRGQYPGGGGNVYDSGSRFYS